MSDNQTFNMIAGAVLGSALLALGLGELSAAIYHPHAPSHETPGYKIDVVDGGEAASDPSATAVTIGTLLASADATKGAGEAKNCTACHDFTKGGPNKQGPNLWDLVERAKATHAGFEYSDGAKAQAGQNWTYENLNEFIKNPKKYMPGTKMGYGGLKNDSKRANLIAYLATLSDTPKPFPAP